MYVDLCLTCWTRLHFAVESRRGVSLLFQQLERETLRQSVFTKAVNIRSSLTAECTRYCLISRRITFQSYPVTFNEIVDFIRRRLYSLTPR
jgi:hypothetical protein